MTLVQIGSGSASLDTNLIDGFSNFILKLLIYGKIISILLKLPSQKIIMILSESY